MRHFRKESGTPIILLTAKLEENDKVLGLELGADDYVTKPFGMRELVARIRPFCGGPPAGTTAHRHRDRGGAARPRRPRGARGGEVVSLTPSEFDLLATLMSTPGHVYSRIELLERLQGTVIDGAEKTINVHIHNLRNKIEPDPANPTYIETVFGIGYRFCRP